MSQSFVWFHNSSDNPSDSSTFYQKLLGWTASEGPGGLTMLAGRTGPFAGLAKKDGGAAAGWIPYVQVDDVDGATNAAVKLGATIVNARVRGPAGEYSVVRDPGGAAIALWQKAWDGGRALSVLQRLLPHLRVKAFGPGHHVLAEENPYRVVELVTQTIREHAATVSRAAVLA
jgi:predicted enzyme related to lactoylglutathione lyase